MLSQNSLHYWSNLKLANFYLIFKAICFAAVLWFIDAEYNYAQAEIVPDKTLGNESSVITPLAPFDRIDGGAVRGTNLFHSFEKFNVDTQQTVFFANPGGIENIISRVTGGSRSEILGTLGVLGGANLFLINPSGIIFGPNAELNMGGSFVGTTADAIGFGEQGFFSASVPNTPQLLTVKPSALLFNQIASQPITIQSTAGLRLPVKQSLLLVGGDVNLEGGKLSVPGGQIELGGLAEIGAVGLNIDGSNLSLNFPDNVAQADVSLSNLAQVDVSFQKGGGNIKVQSKRLLIKEGSQISAGSFNQGTGGSLTVRTTDEVELSGTVILDGKQISSGLFTQAESDGDAGNLTIETKRLILRDGAQISTSTRGSGKAGILNVNASESIQLIGASTGGLGKEGILNVNTPESVQVIGTSNKGSEQAGILNVNPSKSVPVALDFILESSANVDAVPSGLFAVSQGGSGSSGNLTVDAVPSGLFATSQRGSGSSGNLTIETGKLVVRDGAQVSTSTVGIGEGEGNLTVKASESVELIGNLSVNGEVKSRSGLLVGTDGTGTAGKLTIETKNLQVLDGAIVSAGTLGEANGGKVIINASDFVDIIGTSVNGSEPSRITTGTRGGGDAGNLTIETGKLNIRNDAQINSSNTGEGKAGNIKLTAKSINLDRGNIIAQTKSDDGGNIDLSIEDFLLLRRNSQISSTAGTDEAGGNGGNITVNAFDGFIVAVPQENSDITANAFTGDGGEVKINSLGVFGIEPRTQPTDKSDITASSELGIQGITTINTPANSSVQDNHYELPANHIDTNALIANSCIARSTKGQENSFIITGSGGLRNSPID